MNSGTRPGDHNRIVIHNHRDPARPHQRQCVRAVPRCGAGAARNHGVPPGSWWL